MLKGRTNIKVITLANTCPNNGLKPMSPTIESLKPHTIVGRETTIASHMPTNIKAYKATMQSSPTFVTRNMKYPHKRGK